VRGCAAVAAAALTACAVWHGWIQVAKSPPAPVPAVSLELDADEPLQAEPVEPDSLERLHSAFAGALLSHGVSIVTKGQGGAPALIGDIEIYREGDDRVFQQRRGQVRIAWRLVNANGSILGRCVTDVDTGGAWGRADYGALLDAAGAGLANFLLEPKTKVR